MKCTVECYKLTLQNFVLALLLVHQRKSKASYLRKEKKGNLIKIALWIKKKSPIYRTLTFDV